MNGFSPKEKELWDKVEPYVILSLEGSRLRDDAPKEAIDAMKELHEILERSLEV